MEIVLKKTQLSYHMAVTLEFIYFHGGRRINQLRLNIDNNTSCSPYIEKYAFLSSVRKK